MLVERATVPSLVWDASGARGAASFVVTRVVVASFVVTRVATVDDSLGVTHLTVTSVVVTRVWRFLPLFVVNVRVWREIVRREPRMPSRRLLNPHSRASRERPKERKQECDGGSRAVYGACVRGAVDSTDGRS